MFPPTENISQFIDYWLQTLMKAMPSYLKDTTELTNQLKELTVEPDMLFDVKSLYTCIPHKEGIQACAEALENLKANNPDQDTLLISSIDILVVFNSRIDLYPLNVRSKQTKRRD